MPEIKNRKFKLLVMVTTLSLFSASCSSSGSDSAAKPNTDNGQNQGTGVGQTGNAKFKQAILKLLEGTYGDNCLRKEGDDPNVPTSTGSAISVSGSGMISWGGGSHDLTKVLTNDFGVTTTPGSPAVGASFDIKNPTTGDRVAIYGVSVSTQGDPSASVTSYENSTDGISNWCLGPKPAASGASLWTTARQFINFSLTNIDCVDTKTGKAFKGSASFTDTEAKINNDIFPRSSSVQEMLSVNDEATSLPIGLAFSAYDNASSQMIVSIHSDLKFNSIQLTRSDLTMIVCNAP